MLIFYYVHAHGPQCKQVLYAFLCHPSDILKFVYTFIILLNKHQSINQYILDDNTYMYAICPCDYI